MNTTSTSSTTATATEKAEKVFVFDFTDKASYLAYRSEWRSRFKEASAESRRLKRVIAGTQKSGSYAGHQQANLVNLRFALTEILAERRASKVEAGRQWQARKDAEANQLAAE